MISVCMATFNGERYLKEQLDSILSQLGDEDELVVSDDGSSDKTHEIIHAYEDKRIRFFHNQRKGIANNFENALSRARGDFIFLADQDDVWLAGKLDKMVEFLEKESLDVAMCNCALVDQELNIIKSPHFDSEWPMKRTLLSNLYKNAWLGCCMVLRSSVLKATMPFPKGLVAHDLWLALYAQWHFRTGYMDEVLVLYRRHDNTVSFTGSVSTNSLSFKLKYRLHLLYHLIGRSLKNSFSGPVIKYG
ncbi:MAG TPA: glycosyltransferase family 2 protein [Bacteroidales bacterium]|jgi:glycosyltransferase involved in cell wall biosynthesis|nr:glycosyltransferase family 2 protein [Bacteroidota bacterium]NLV37635.1 glycosyltransferase family 2 protein [Bacteroidales bacterium]HOD27260.1 glycosyltransferase family 2 protein [Bacteroidales bacterium]HQM93866.1 glycosyltransferase family 2 protein [Bacteroidales bacterium]